MAKSSTKTLTLLVFAVIIGIAYGAPRFFDRLWLPWAYPRGGGKPLPSIWVGSLTTATGQRFGILLDLRLRTYYGTRGGRDWRSAPYGSFDGTLRSCDASGTIQEYKVSGSAEDRHASKVHIYGAPVEKPPHQGLTFSWFNGTWDGADDLELAANIFIRRGKGSTTGPDFPDTQTHPRLALTRAAETDFTALCARLSRA